MLVLKNLGKYVTSYNINKDKELHINLNICGYNFRYTDFGCIPVLIYKQNKTQLSIWYYSEEAFWIDLDYRFNNKKIKITGYLDLCRENVASFLEISMYKKIYEQGKHVFKKTRVFKTHHSWKDFYDKTITNNFIFRARRRV